MYYLSLEGSKLRKRTLFKNSSIMTISYTKFNIQSVVRCSRDIYLSDAMFGLVGCCVAAVVEVLTFGPFLLVISWCDIFSRTVGSVVFC